MRCGKAEERLSAYIDGELSAERRDAVAAHLASCPACAGRERALRAAWDDVGSLPGPAPVAELWPGVLRALAGATSAAPHRLRLRVAAAVAACAAAGLAAGTLFAFRFSGPPRHARVAARAPAGDDSFADAFGDLSVDLLAAPPGDGGGETR